MKHDKWVPIFWLPQSLLPNHILQDNLKVNMLMHQYNGAWDVDLIESIFPPLVANATIKLPLHTRTWEDKFVWTCTRNGLYLVKSGYYLAVILYDSTIGVESSYYHGYLPF